MFLHVCVCVCIYTHCVCIFLNKYLSETVRRCVCPCIYVFVCALIILKLSNYQLLQKTTTNKPKCSQLFPLTTVAELNLYHNVAVI